MTNIRKSIRSYHQRGQETCAKQYSLEESLANLHSTIKYQCGQEIRTAFNPIMTSLRMVLQQ
jgi:hypothetical protein